MPKINLEQSFRYAINGNTVVEFQKGVHDVCKAVVEVAARDLKIAKNADKEAEPLPRIEFDLSGNPLSEAELSFLDQPIPKSIDA